MYIHTNIAFNGVELARSTPTKFILIIKPWWIFLHIPPLLFWPVAHAFYTAVLYRATNHSCTASVVLWSSFSNFFTSVSLLGWRHDSVLKQLVCSLDNLLNHNQILHTDLPGRLANMFPPATIPPNISSTLDRPVISNTEISILELTICKNFPTGSLKQKIGKNQSMLLW